MLSERGLVDTPLDEELKTLAVRSAEYHCADCGYGAMLRSERPPCPMCGGRSWESGAWSPFARRPA